MNYLKVPDSNIKLTDGSVVMLARFPGTKWVVHYGWYDYSGRRGMGWYFSSIPAQTIIPVTAQDLQLIVLIDQGKSDDPVRPPIPDVDPAPAPGPDFPPKSHHRPHHDHPDHGIGPIPPWPVPIPDPGLYPVTPGEMPPPPTGDPRAFFSKNDQYLLDASWITLPSIKYRDTLSTVCNVPDGKMVMVLNVDGVTRYYRWNGPDQRWDEKFFENDAEKLLVNYYDIQDIDEKFGVVNDSISTLEHSTELLTTTVEQTEDAITILQTQLSDETAARNESITAERQSRIAADTAEAATRAEEISRLTESITGWQEELSEFKDDVQLDFEEETNARVAADNAEIQARTQAINNEAIARQEADDSETAARRAADEELYRMINSLSNIKDITILLLGNGDTIENASWDSSTKTLVLEKGNAGSAPSVVTAIQSALATCVKHIYSDRGSSILVDDSDKSNVEISLNIASGSDAGNVELEECSDGLRANVTIPPVPVQGVRSDEKIISLDGNNLYSTLSISTETSNNKTYVVLKGIQGVEISRFDASEFVTAGMIQSVKLEEVVISGQVHKMLVITFLLADGSTDDVSVDLNDLIDAYSAAVNGGLTMNSNNEFSIANVVTPNTSGLNEDINISFNSSVTLNTLTYDAHGSITGTKQITLTIPGVSGSIGTSGSTNKLLTYASLSSTGTLSGESIDVVNALSSSSTNSQVPTAKAVYDLVSDSSMNVATSSEFAEMLNEVFT